MFFKSCSIKIKDLDSKKGIVQGYFASFGTLDSDEDVFEKGAFKKSILEVGPKSQKPRVKHLLDHSTAKAIGTLLELEEDNIGLLYTSQLGRHSLGRDALMMYEDGIITEHSVGFNTIKSENGTAGYNIIKEARLWEGSSLQAWGANMNTPVVGVKTFTKEDIKERINKFQKALRVGNYTDETFEMLLIELEQLKGLILQAEVAMPPHVPELDTKNEVLAESFLSKINQLKTIK